MVRLVKAKLESVVPNSEPETFINVRGVLLGCWEDMMKPRGWTDSSPLLRRQRAGRQHR